MSKLNDFFLKLYPFSVVFEAWRPSFFSENLSLSFIIAFLYVLTSLRYINDRIKNLYRERWFKIIISYFILDTIVTIFNFQYIESPFKIMNTNVFLNLFLISLCYAHIVEKPNLFQSLLKSFALAMGLVGFFNFMGIGIELDKGRLQSFGEDANTVANKAFFGLLFSYFILKFYIKTNLVKILYLGTLLLSLYVLISTGSRGPFLVLLLVIVFNFLLSKKSSFFKIIITLILLFFSSLFMQWFLNSNLLLAERLTDTVESGQTGRNEIWPAAIKAIIDNPLGVGYQGALPTMNKYLGSPMDPHNIFLWVTLTGGFFSLFLFMCFQRHLFLLAYKSFKNSNIQFLIYWLGITFISLQAGAIINKKFLWFIYLLILSSKLNLKKNESISYIR